MENASRALLMAGGILIAILVISLLVMAFTQMSDYQKGNSDLVLSSQLAKFNEQFTQYARNDLKGVDLISLVNRVVDFNKKTSGAGEIDYLNSKIEVDVTLGQAFSNKYGGIVAFKTSEYKITSSNANQTTNFSYIIKNLMEKENAIGLKALDALVSNLSSLEAKYDNRSDNDTYAKSVEEIVGNSLQKTTAGKALYNKIVAGGNNNAGIAELKQYEEYSRIKESTFKLKDGTNTEYYPNGQVKRMQFIFAN